MQLGLQNIVFFIQCLPLKIDMLQVYHNLFACKPKKYIELYNLTLMMMETKCLKLLNNASTSWVSLIASFKWLLSEYCSI